MGGDCVCPLSTAEAEVQNHIWPGSWPKLCACLWEINSGSLASRCPQQQSGCADAKLFGVQGLHQRLEAVDRQVAERDAAHQTELTGEAVRRKELQGQVCCPC